MRRLVLIDGHAILHRAFHALPPLSTSKGELVNAAFGFTSMLLRVINNLKPTHLAVVFDTPAKTFRNKLSKEYQAKRPKMDVSLIRQVGLVHKLIVNMGIPFFEKDGWEADDIIGTIAKLSTINSHLSEVIIVTGDKDLLQLVDEKTKVYMPVKGLSESKLYGEKEVEEKFGVKPSQVIDYKALAGDASDNYSGVPGIGPKTASLLLIKFGKLEDLYLQLNKLNNDVLKKKLESSKKEAQLSKKLATIVTNVPIEFELESCLLKNFDRPDVHRLFERYEFLSLIPRLSNKTKNPFRQSVDQINPKVKEEKKKDNEQISLF